MNKWCRLFSKQECEKIRKCRKHQRKNPDDSHSAQMIIAKLSLLVEDLEKVTESNLELNGSIDAFIDSWEAGWRPWFGI